MAKKKKPARVKPRPPTPTTRPLEVRFRDNTTTVFAPGAVGEIRQKLLLVGRQGEMEGEYQLKDVKGWRYLDASAKPSAAGG